MSASGRRTPRPPLGRASLEELSLRYVARFATSRAKLRTYLERKLRERGWEEGEPSPDIPALADRFAERGYIDDAAFALARSRSLAARGYGKRRLVQSLRAAGITDGDDEGANIHADAEAVGAALRFAQRRKLGPFATARADDPRMRQRALASMIRGGHSFALARAVLALAPGATPDPEELAQAAGLPGADVGLPTHALP